MKLSPSLLMLMAGAAAAIASVSMFPLSRGGSVAVIDPAYQVELVSRTGYRMPDGLLWQPDGVYFADEGAGLLQKLVPGGVQRLHFPQSAIVSPEDVATNGRGDFYFTDDETGGVWRWNADSGLRLLAGPDQGIRRSEGIAVDGAGDIFVGDGEEHCIFRISPAGLTETFVTGIAKPETLTFDTQGGLYVGDSGDGKLFYIANGRARLVMHDRQVVPETIVWHDDGLLMTDSVHGRLYRWTPGGLPEVIAAFGGNLRQVSGVTADNSGNIWVSVQTSVAGKKGVVFKLSRKLETTSR